MYSFWFVGLSRSLGWITQEFVMNYQESFPRGRPQVEKRSITLGADLDTEIISSPICNMWYLGVCKKPIINFGFSTVMN